MTAVTILAIANWLLNDDNIGAYIPTALPGRGRLHLWPIKARHIGYYYFMLACLKGCCIARNEMPEAPLHQRSSR